MTQCWNNKNIQHHSGQIKNENVTKTTDQRSGVKH